MISDELAKEMLRNIALTGAVNEENSIIKPVIAGIGNLDVIVNRSAGLPRIRDDKVKQFGLIIQQPVLLAILNSFEIRCCLCRRVISYPAWYYEIQYAVSHIHFFICFDSNSSTKPTTRCMRKG